MTTMPSVKLHSDARCHSLEVGEGTELEAFAYVESGARVGSDCLIGAHCYIEKGVSLGNKVIAEGGSRFYSGLVVEDEVHVGRNATLARTVHRGVSKSGQATSSILLRHGCHIGANATICPGVTVGAHAIVDVGAVVTHSVQHYAIVSGNPAQVVGFVNAKEPVSTGKGIIDRREVGVTASLVKGVTAYDIPYVSDPRGNLTVGEFERTLPFQPKRYFMTFDVPSATLRGEHAHRTCHQLLICMHGSCALVVDDGVNREEYLLDRPTFGIHVPPMIWATEYKHTSDSALLVFASEYYDAGDYIRDYHQYLKELRPL